MAPRRRGPMILGVVVIALGVLWLFRNLGLFQVNMGGLIAIYWPVLLIAWGIDILIPRVFREETQPGSLPGRLLNGLVLIVVGVIIIGGNLGYYNLNLGIFWRVFWPALIILLGWSLLQGAASGGGTHWAVMSGLELKNQGWKLEDGSYIAVMGGAKIDLRAAEIPPRETVLNLTAVMGGIEVRVPEGLKVSCQGTAVLGGLNFFREEAGGVVASRKTERPGTGDPAASVIIQCRAVMGGIEVKET
ncbi:MAG: hypothetical protein C4570_08060 [Ammonifex sp.]|nr:MAG: hypothetical protein C4570_08060 [Ammonifex sp.]